MTSHLPSTDLSRLSTDDLLEHLRNLRDRSDIAGKMIVELQDREDTLSLGKISELTDIPKSTVSLWSRQAKAGEE